MWLFIIIFISFTFWLASISKVFNIGAFADLLVYLQIPGAARWPRQLAIIVIFFEMLVACLTLSGGVWTLIGLIFASLLMVLFIFIIGYMLRKEAQRSCNCFGRSKRPVNRLDLIRNIGLCLCSTTGVCISQTVGPLPANKIEIGLIGVLSLAIAIFWVNLGEIYEVFKA